MLKFIFLSMLLITCSCSTVLNGKKQLISVNSNVKGADIIVDGKNVGTTPFNGKVERGNDVTVTVQKEGYEPKTIVINSDVAPAFWANVLFVYGSSSSSTTDYLSGAMYKYSPAHYNIDLEKRVEQGK